MIGHNHIGHNGRFGNQMFQYAATRGIAAKHGYQFAIPDGPKSDAAFTDEEEQHKLFMAFKMHGARSVFELNAPYKQEGSFRFDEDFEFRDDVKKLCDEIWKEIVTDEGHAEAIGLHVRRTDHLIKPTYHPVLPISYYEEALSKLPEDIPVFVFTDDPMWAFGHEFFESDRFFISESDNVHDMCLMSMCNYNIIANSTFSWWGAWLAGHNRVIGPKLWFGPDGEDPTDIYQKEWEYLDVAN